MCCDLHMTPEISLTCEAAENDFVFANVASSNCGCSVIVQGLKEEGWYCIDVGSLAQTKAIPPAFAATPKRAITKKKTGTLLTRNMTHLVLSTSAR